MKNTIIFVFLFLFSLGTMAQNTMQYSHALRSQKLLNPAYNRTGNDITFYTVHRNQWSGMPGAPVAQAFNLQMPFVKHGMGVGLTFVNNRWAFFNENNIMLSYSYSIKLNKSNVAFGVQGGVNTYKIDNEEVMSNDADLFKTQNTLLPNIGWGVYYSYENLSTGVSVPQVFSYKAVQDDGFSIENQFDIKKMPIYLYAGYDFTITDDISIEPYCYVRVENCFATQTDIYAHVKLKNMFKAGVGLRSYNVFVFYAGFKLRNVLELEYSFDLLTSELSNTTKGTHEIGLLFNISKHKTPIHKIDKT